MENGNWSLFNSSSNNNNTTCGSSRGQNSNCNSNLAWDTWELGTSLFGWGSSSSTTPNNNNNNNNNNNPFYQTATNTTTATSPKPLMLNSLYGGGAGGSHIHPDPHLMCLKLGKRQYFEDVMASPLGDCHVGGLSVKKRGRGVARPPPSTAAVVVAKCRVEGCEVGLGKAKEYHRRHKVCEIHSKAEKAVVHGVDHRFCQQCSRNHRRNVWQKIRTHRFHEVSEFDDSKRSCRRRLVGHNQRRRKRSLHSIATNPFQEKKMMGERFPYVSSLTGHALSLLSTKRNSWLSASDFSSQCSAALHELIAENRTAMNGTQPASSSLDHHQMFTEPHGRSWWTLDA